MLDLILSQAVNGLVLGFLYVLIATGLSIIFGMLGVVNFAHGAFFALGAYFALTLQAEFGLQREREVGAERKKGPVREVHHAQHAEDDRQAGGNQHIQETKHQAVDGLGQDEIQHLQLPQKIERPAARRLPRAASGRRRQARAAGNKSVHREKISGDPSGSRFPAACRRGHRAERRRWAPWPPRRASPTGR